MFSSSYSQALCLFFIKYPYLSHTQESTLATSQLFAEETLSGGLCPFTFWISILLSLFEISWDSLLHSLTIAFSWNETWGMNTNILFEAAVLVFVLPLGTKSLNTAYNGNWTQWSAIWAENICLISKSNECQARVRFEITSRISDKIALHEVQSPLYCIHFEMA